MFVLFCHHSTAGRKEMGGVLMNPPEPTQAAPALAELTLSIKLS